MYFGHISSSTNKSEFLKQLYIYEPPHDKTNKMMCAQRRLRSAWASAQSDQSLPCVHEESLGPKLPLKSTAKTDQTGWMTRLI